MPKPLKSLLIVFSVLVFAGILALAWNQWPWPAGDKVANGTSSGSAPATGPATGQSTPSAETGAGQAATADSGTTGETPAQSAESATSAQPEAAGDQAASSATGDQPAAADAGADDAAGTADKVAAVTPDAEVGSAQGTPPAGEAATPSDAPDATVQPSFDIVRVEPSGDTVIAGRSASGAIVELLSNGSVIAMTTADAAGEFVLVLEKPLAAGGHDLALRTSGSEGVSIYSKTNVAVAVPEEPTGEVLVVMNEPGAASQILAKPDEATSAEVSTETAAEGETVIAVAPSVKAQMAAPEAPVADDTSGEPAQATETAEPAATGEPAMAETVTVAPEAQPQPQMAEATPAAPVAPEPPAQTAEASPAVPEAQPQPQMAEATPAAPVTPEPPAQTAEASPVASDEKPAEGSEPVADGGQAAAEVASAPPVPLAVEAVEVEGGKLFAAGTAKPGEIVRVYIDGKPTGETTTLDNGRWLLETEANVAAGTLIVRADQLAPGRTKVVARAEVPFTKQVNMAVLIPTAKGGSPGGATAAGELQKPNSVIIRRGDNLWTISRRTYGRGIRYTTIYTANKDQIRNPHRIYPGQVFMLPVGDKAWTQ